MARNREKQKYPIVHVTDTKDVTSTGGGAGIATVADANRDASGARSSVSSKLTAESVVVNVRNADVDHIRAVLALKPIKQQRFGAGVWGSVAVVVLLGAFADWQWTQARENAADNIAPPQITMPKPPDFASRPSAPNSPASAAASNHRSGNGGAQPGSGN